MSLWLCASLSIYILGSLLWAKRHANLVFMITLNIDCGGRIAFDSNVCALFVDFRLSVVCTILSFTGLQCWMEMSLDKYQIDGLIFEDFINLGNVTLVLYLLLGSYITLALVTSFALNAVIMVILCLKTFFFSELNSSEIRKLVEHLINYISARFCSNIVRIIFQPQSLCAITSLIGVVMIGLIEDDGWKTGWPFLSIRQLIAYSILAM